MEKKDARRKRRAEEDLLPLLQKRRNEFLSYAYVGNPEVMMSLFPDCDFKIIPNYFDKIPTSVFNDPKVIKDYGKKLKELRTKMNCTLVFSEMHRLSKFYLIPMRQRKRRQHSQKSHLFPLIT